MLLYFNKNGQLLEQLTYGTAPRVGMTVFQIFAYFENIDLENYGAALIRFKRPDINGSEYPDLFMVKAQINFDSSVENSNYFNIENNPYSGYVFDFEKVQDGDSIITMLDTPGMWEASITLVNTRGGKNVTGLVRFNVGGAVSGADDEATELDYSVITNNIAGAVAQKLDLNSLKYLRTHDDFKTAAVAGTLLASAFVTGAFVYDKKSNSILQITSTALNPSDESYVTAQWVVICVVGPEDSNVDEIIFSNGAEIIGKTSVIPQNTLSFKASTLWLGLIDDSDSQAAIIYDENEDSVQIRNTNSPGLKITDDKLLFNEEPVATEKHVANELQKYIVATLENATTLEDVFNLTKDQKSKLCAVGPYFVIVGQQNSTTYTYSVIALDTSSSKITVWKGTNSAETTITSIINTTPTQVYATEDFVATAISNAIGALGQVLSFQGSKTVAELNALTNQQPGDFYNVLDAGTLTEGSVSVVAGDNVAWTNNNVWDKMAGEIDFSNFVTKTGTETISGNKTFTGTIYANSILSEYGHSAVLGGTPSVGTNFSWVFGNVSATYLNATYLRKFKLQYGDVSEVYTYTLPDSDGTIALDGSVVHLANAETITGTKTFNKDSGYGNVEIRPGSTTETPLVVVSLATSYAQTEMGYNYFSVSQGTTPSSKWIFNTSGFHHETQGTGDIDVTFPTESGQIALDGKVVHLANSETITGKKTFTGGVECDDINPPFGNGGAPHGSVGDVPTVGSNTGTVYANVSGYNIYANAIKKFKLQYESVTNIYTYTLPDADGTIALTSDLTTKQDALVSGANIKTINNQSILGSGNITITGSGSGLYRHEIYPTGSAICLVIINNNPETGAGVDYQSIDTAMQRKGTINMFIYNSSTGRTHPITGWTLSGQGDEDMTINYWSNNGQTISTLFFQAQDQTGTWTTYTI